MLDTYFLLHIVSVFSQLIKYHVAYTISFPELKLLKGAYDYQILFSSM